MRGRPKGSRDLKPRKRRGTIDEFMPPTGGTNVGAGEPDTELETRSSLEPPAPTSPPETDEVKTLKEAIRDIWSDPAYQESLKARLVAGKATPAEQRMVEQWQREEQARVMEERNRKSPTLTALAVSNEIERAIFANMCRRAKGQPERPFIIPNTNRAMTLVEMVQVVQRTLGAMKPWRPRGNNSGPVGLLDREADG